MRMYDVIRDSSLRSWAGNKKVYMLAKKEKRRDLQNIQEVLKKPTKNEKQRN